MGLSSTVIVAVPTAADSWTQVGTITIPQGMKRIEKIQIGLSPDNGTTLLSVRNAPVVRLLGDGLVEQTPHEYLGAFGGMSGVVNGGTSQEGLDNEHMTDIPVSVGGTLEVQVKTLDEAITAGTVTVTVFFDEKAPTSSNSMSQIVEAAGDTTADRWTNIGTIRIPKPEDAKAPKKIIMLTVACAVDQGTSAAVLRGTPRYRITGDGLVGSGTREFAGVPFQTIGVAAVAGGAPLSNLTKQIKVDIECNAGGSILVEQRFDVETPTASTMAAAVAYA